MSSCLGLTLESAPQFKITAPYLDYVLTMAEMTHVGFSEVKKIN